jgi:hypothetical protein
MKFNVLMMVWVVTPSSYERCFEGAVLAFTELLTKSAMSLVLRDLKHNSPALSLS